MSGSNDDRWRPARGQQNAPPHLTRQNNQQQRRNPSREGGDAWHNNDRSNKDGSSQAIQEGHTPFNAQEVRDALKTGYNSSGIEDAKALKYKAPAPVSQANNTKPASPWGSKPNIMANGKDFFVELRKQVSAAQQGTERAGG